MTHAKRVLGGAVPPSLLLAAAVLAGPLHGQSALRSESPQTRAERSAWQETSRYEDVMAFLDAVEAIDADAVLHRTTFGYTMEGRPLPLVVVGEGLAGADPDAVLAAGRTRVYVQANIHAGEVEGKEAVQALLRRFAAGQHRAWLDSLVVLIAPIFNADGNERISVLNRTRQNGPFGGVGERTNAQGLDLNRDHMKLESPEARSLAGLLQAYDPHLVVDLHTTNGTPHAYHLTYAPPLHPDTDPGIVTLLRERWLPEMTRRMREEHGFHTYYYGNAYKPRGGEYGWYTFDYRPRFNTNYAGVRNRFAILSETYAYVSFEERVRANVAFVEEILDFAARHAGAIARTAREADARDLRGRRLALRAELERGNEVEILMGQMEPRLSQFSGREYLARTDSVRPERMRDYTTFAATELERVPAAYYVPAELDGVANLLTLHGVRVVPLETDRRVTAQRFRVDSTRVAAREFQGHREREVFGEWVSTEVDLPSGTLEVPMDQPLARLVFHLLEPRAPDGVVNWNMLDAVLEEAEPGAYPIVRRPAAGG